MAFAPKSCPARWGPSPSLRLQSVLLIQGDDNGKIAEALSWFASGLLCRVP